MRRGRKPEVASITEAAMRGEITDYKDSLRQRVALLKGVPVAAMTEVLTHRLALNPGAKTLVTACQQAGMLTLVGQRWLYVFHRSCPTNAGN
jgi:phosphoserine phosphatase